MLEPILGEIPVGNCARTLDARGRAAEDPHNLIDLLPTQGACAFLSPSLMDTSSARITDAPVPAWHHCTRGRTGSANATFTIEATPVRLEELEHIALFLEFRRCVLRSLLGQRQVFLIIQNLLTKYRKQVLRIAIRDKYG